MAAHLIVFDLDGTLIDTAPDLIGTLNVILAREHMPAFPYDDARLLIGRGARRMVERALEAEGRATTPALVDRLYDDFLAHYAAHIAEGSRPFPHLDTALDALAGRDCRFAVCTNKLEGLSIKLLDALGLSQRFAAICGQDTFGVMKPDPGALIGTIARAAGEPARTIMVGDSETDVLTARAAGIPIVAVDFGYTEQPVSTFGPDRVISSLAALPDAVSDLASQRN